jgi:hypothetical protein
VLPSFLAHTFCNLMGLPAIGQSLADHPTKKICELTPRASASSIADNSHLGRIPRWHRRLCLLHRQGVMAATRCSFCSSVVGMLVDLYAPCPTSLLPLSRLLSSLSVCPAALRGLDSQPYSSCIVHPCIPNSSARVRLDDGTGVRGDTGPEVGALLGDAEK